jgi:hypothetical protein
MSVIAAECPVYVFNLVALVASSTTENETTSPAALPIVRKCVVPVFEIQSKHWGVFVTSEELNFAEFAKVLVDLVVV